MKRRLNVRDHMMHHMTRLFPVLVIFRIYDKDGDGKISKDDLAHVSELQLDLQAVK